MGYQDATGRRLSYGSYLKIPELLDLQHGLTDAHDELLFIVVHQVYELWFKVLLDELEATRDAIQADELRAARHYLARVKVIEALLVEQVAVLETMAPQDFLTFRSELAPASGFQSVQFREFEFLLGYKRLQMLRFVKPETPEYQRLVKRLHERSVVDCFYDFLEQHGVMIPSELRTRDITLPTVPDPAVEAGLLKLYKSQPDLEILFELMTDFDEGFQEWRYRHIKLVERSIGSKRGTGGSLGVEFLKKSLFHPVFLDLWAIRRFGIFRDRILAQTSEVIHEDE